MNPLLLLGALAAAPQAVPAPPADSAPVGREAADAVTAAAEPPLILDARYKGDTLAVVRGGVQRGVRYLDNLDVTLAADLDRLAGVRNTRAFAYGLYNNGTSFSATLAGDAQVVSNIETGIRAARLYELWLEHGDDALSVRAGLYDVSTEFDVLESAAMFLHSAQGTGTDLSQSGNNGPSIFPFTSPGIRVQARVRGDAQAGLTLRAAVLDGTPGDPDHPQRTVIRLREQDGAFMIGEAEWRMNGVRLLAGAWRYTARFALQEDAATMRSGNGGVYLRGEVRLAGDDRRGVTGFVRTGVASGRFNVFDRFAGAGITVNGVLRDDGADALGLAVAHARTTPRLRPLTEGMTAGETAFELTYRTRVNAHLWVQPDLQYIADPAAMSASRNVWVAGVRLELRLRP